MPRPASAPILAIAAAALLGACAARSEWPRVISTPALRAQPVTQGPWISNYDTALVSIARLMEGELGLPIAPVDLVFFRDREAFQAALEAGGYDGDLAVDAASTMTAITGPRRILLNDGNLRPLDWPYRVALLAHELAHTVQYELGGGRRGASEQWVREGFAEWVEIEVLAGLGFTTREQAHRIALDRIRRARALPPLVSLATFPDWVRVGLKTGTDALYAQALLAAGLLVEQHGVPAVLDYFRAFEASEDRAGNFERAFGQDLDDFDRSFEAWVASRR